MMRERKGKQKEEIKEGKREKKKQGRNEREWGQRGKMKNIGERLKEGKR